MKLLNFTQFVNENILEAVAGLEPVFTPKKDTAIMDFPFEEGQFKFSTPVSTAAIAFMKKHIKSSIPTIEKFISNSGPSTSGNWSSSGPINNHMTRAMYEESQSVLPPIIQFYVGTSSTGTQTVNSNLAQKRMDYLTGLYLEVMNSFGIKDGVSRKLMTQAPKDYQPAPVNNNFYDSTKLAPVAKDRLCQITINPITTMGNTPGQIGNIQGTLIDASSIINTVLGDLVDEKEIVRGILKLQTYSDITDLNTALINARKGTLEEFLNRELANHDEAELSQIVSYLNTTANLSNETRRSKGDIAKIVGRNTISILI